jgi:membrane fusion protein (multidrug efflux system)
MKINLSPKKLMIAVPIVAVVVVFGLYFTYRLIFFEGTDDAFVKAHIHTISPRVMGTVRQVLVEDNQMVKKGEPLVKLDPRDYEVAIKEAQVNYSKAHKDLGRFRGFNDLGPTERPVFDQYQQAGLLSEAQLNRAQLQLEYTIVSAPEDGKIGKRAVETGDQIQAGQAIMALVESQPWIEANFKEHQVSKLHVGQEVEIKIDAFPGESLKGKVESIAPGSGSTFSLLPPDNATGNFTKIVQRIPVKIILESGKKNPMVLRLVSGMSAEVSIKVR